MECRKIIVPYISDVYPELMDLEELDVFSSNFEQIGRPLQVDFRPWRDYPGRPEVSVRAAASSQYLFLKFSVKEREILGRYENDNDPVFKDSCVGVMLTLNEEEYYSFEFNCIGTCLAESGTGGDDRVLLNPDLLRRIIRLPSLGQRTCCIHKTGLMEEVPPWSLLVAIPGDVFLGEGRRSLQGQKFRGNFFKCGEDLENPHYLSWNPVIAENPDFHVPESFGEIWIS